MKERLSSVVRRAWNSPTVTTWVSFAARTLNLVLVLPLVLSRFSAPEVALWQVFTTLIALQILADLGFGSTFTRLFAYAMGGAREIPVGGAVAKALQPGGEPNWDLLGRISATMRSIYSRLAWLLGGLLLAGGSFALLQRIGALEISPAEATDIHRHTTTTEAWLAWGCILVSTVTSFRANIYSAFLQGTNHVALVRRWEALFGICSILTSFVALLGGGGLLALVLANQLWTILAAWRNARLARTVLDARFRTFPAAKMDREIFAAAWAPAWRSGIRTLMTHGLVMISSLIYAQSPDSVAVATYLLGLRLIQTVSQISQAPFYSKLPLFSRLWAQGDTASLVATAKRGMLLAYWAYVLPFIALGLGGAWLLELIGSRTPFPSALMWGLLGLSYLLQRYGAMHLQLYSATNHIVWHIANGVTGVIFIVSALFAFQVWGVIGLPLAMLAGNVLFYCWYCARLSHRQFKLPWPGFDLRTFGAPLLLLLGYLVVFK
jgi:hypothetical protein